MIVKTIFARIKISLKGVGDLGISAHSPTSVRYKIRRVMKRDIVCKLSSSVIASPFPFCRYLCLSLNINVKMPFGSLLSQKRYVTKDRAQKKMII